MTERHKHIKDHAGQHHHAHESLHELLSREVKQVEKKAEKVWPTFLATFIVVLVALTVFNRASEIKQFFATKEATEIVSVTSAGFQKGVVSVYRVEDQATRVYRNYLAQIPSDGYLKGVEATSGAGKGQVTITDAPTSTGIEEAIKLTNTLSEGQHLTNVDQAQTKALQKSILATYYLGERTSTVNSTIQNDTVLLGKINNALQTDLFQYLNQADNRADALASYTALLRRLNFEANSRINELNSNINFLSANFEATQAGLNVSEEAFFDNLQRLDGPNAEEELAQFIGFQEQTAEIRAKMGAYVTLRDYYDILGPQLENLITAIEANRDALIAGVKVVEIENMTLPLIERP